MKKLTLTLAAVLASTILSFAQSQADLQQMAATVDVRVSTTTIGTNHFHVYTVIVPEAVNSALSSAKKASETDQSYVRRAFVYGATGLIKEKNGLIAKRVELRKQQAALTNSIHQIDTQLK